MLKNGLSLQVLRASLAVLVVLALASTSGTTQDKKGKGKLPDFIPAGYDDYQNMLDQLGIKKMRRGRDSKVKDTSSEATANPWKDTMPELMTFKDGAKVKAAEQWPKRRAEIVEDFEREVYGRIPKNVPKVKWEVTSTVEGEMGGIAIVTKTLVGTVDNSAFPKIKVAIQASFTVPKYAAGKVPILIQYSFGIGGFGGKGGANSWQQQALNNGWGYGTISPGSIQPDNSRLREGIIGLTNKGEPRRPDDWGALRAWGWGLSCLIDYFEANPDSGVDPAKVCITGVSRYGKAALVATAFETRVAAGFVASSGAGGAKLFRRDFGELLENLASRGGYHWMAGNFLKYAADDSQFGKKTVADLPVDQHQLIALCAPRLCLISYGIPAKGDPNWVDAHGSFMAGVLAAPAYKLLGKKDLGTPGDYLTDKRPAVNTLIGGELAWRQHDGGHTNGPNFPTFFEWAGRYISTPGLTKKK
jgi:(4-O-methyl)-D-glucuronate---lignin esterase